MQLSAIFQTQCFCLIWFMLHSMGGMVMVSGHPDPVYFWYGSSPTPIHIWRTSPGKLVNCQMLSFSCGTFHGARKKTSECVFEKKRLLVRPIDAYSHYYTACRQQSHGSINRPRHAISFDLVQFHFFVSLHFVTECRVNMAGVKIMVESSLQRYPQTRVLTVLKP